MARKLILFNGRGWVLTGGRKCETLAKLLEGVERPDLHVYLAAHSAADAVRMIEEYNGGWPKARNEIAQYFHKDCWGNAMEGITPERGMWVVLNRHRDLSAKPVRLV